jgi:uncharacterized delta-60 repeat protein
VAADAGGQGTFDAALVGVPGSLATDGAVLAQLQMPDGDIVAVGEFTRVWVEPVRNLLWFDAIGIADLSKPQPSFTAGASRESVWDLFGYADGRVLVGGSFDAFGGRPDRKLVRVTADGRIDGPFSASLGAGFDGDVYDIDVHGASGRIFVAGRFDSVNGHPSPGLAALNPDGTVFSDFRVGRGYIDAAGNRVGLTDNPTGFQPSKVTVDQVTGDVYAGGGFTAIGSRLGHNNLARFEGATGYLDERFMTGATAGTDSGVDALLAVSNAGTTLLYVAGEFTAVGGVSSAAVVRLTTNGDLDSTFADAAHLHASNPGGVVVLAPLPNGQLYVAGDFDFTGPQQDQHGLLRLNADGSVDTTFVVGQDRYFDVSAMAVLPDLSVVVAGQRQGSGFILRLTAAGVVDPAFAKDADLTAGANARALLRIGEDKFVVGGVIAGYRGIAAPYLAKFDPVSFELDTAFMAQIAPNEALYALALDPVHFAAPMLYLGGYFGTYNGTSGRFGLVRVDAATGAFDPSFTPPNDDINPHALVIIDGTGDPTIDGDVLAAGMERAATVWGEAITGMARFNPDGSVDTSFVQRTGADIGFNNDANAVIFDPVLGDLFIGGEFTAYRGGVANRLIRLNLDGSVDSAWVDVGPNDGVYALAQDGAGNLVVGGAWSGIPGFGQTAGVCKVTPNGAIVPEFARFADPNLDVYSLATSGAVLFVGGAATWAFGLLAALEPQDGLVALDLTTGAPLAAFVGSGGVGPAVDGVRVHSILVWHDALGDLLSVAGRFESYARQGDIAVFANHAMLDATSGAVVTR